MRQRKNILIAGGAGYVGGYMTDYLCGMGYNVTVYDNLMYEKRYLKDVPFIFGDIRDRQKLKEILPEFDVVIWLAAIVGDGACTVDPFLTQAINEDATKWLVDNYEGTIVFASTCSVYGINHNLIDEDATPNPISLYAETKLEAETYILANAKNPLVFRLGTLFGVGDALSRIRLDLVVNVLTKKAALHEVLTVFGGDQWRPLLHVRDVATAVDYSLERGISGLYNLAYSNFTIRQISEEINKIIPDVKVEYVELPFEDMRNYRVSTERFSKEGWVPRFDIGYGIEQINAIVTQHRIRNLNDPIYSNVGFLGSCYYKI